MSRCYISQTWHSDATRPPQCTCHLTAFHELDPTKIPWQDLPCIYRWYRCLLRFTVRTSPEYVACSTGYSRCRNYSPRLAYTSTKLSSLVTLSLQVGLKWDSLKSRGSLIGQYYGAPLRSEHSIALLTMSLSLSLPLQITWPCCHTSPGKVVSLNDLQHNRRLLMI